MKKTITAVLVLTALFCIVISCNKTEKYNSAELSEYMNLQVGKFVRYQLDSTLYVNFGQKDTVVKYQAKEVVEAAITDNLGRPSFRVVRYLSDTTGTAPWVPSTTIMITPLRETVELIENNFRYQKLKLPIQENFNWKGNSYISVESTDPNWEFRYLDDWDYMYESVGEPFTVWGNKVVDNSITVNQRDEIIGFPSDPSAYSEQTISKEVYGLGIGMIYRNFLHWVYQPPNGGNPGYKVGYGIKMTMIDHN